MNFKVLAIFLFLQQIQGKETVNIQVYYESLCPDSINFITKQLYPTYQALGNYMDIEFIPFGNADVSFYDLSFASQKKTNIVKIPTILEF